MGEGVGRRRRAGLVVRCSQEECAMALTPGDCKRPQRVDEESLAAAYSRTGTDWQVGPGRIYDRLAEIVLLGCPVPVNGARVLDVGAGTGAGSRAAREVGAGHV